MGFSISQSPTPPLLTPPLGNSTFRGTTPTATLLERLDQYKKRRSRCTIDLSIYEGDWDDFDGTTSEGLDAWEKGKKK